MDLNKLKGLLKEHGLIQKDLAKILKISVQSVNSKLNGKIEFKMSEFKIIIKHFEIKDPIIFLSNNSL